MKFDNADTAWQFWSDYGFRVGFGVRKQYFNKNRKDGTVTSCRFVCCKEGVRKEDKRNTPGTNHRLETRIDCKVRVTLVLRKGKLIINEFVDSHNHPLQLLETAHMLASHRNISEVQGQEIELAEDSGLLQKATFQLMSTHAGGRSNLGFTRLDAKNYLRSKRQRKMVYREVGCLLQYFQRQVLDNPSFFHAYQMDADEQITNVFWADARMIVDYGYFGDVVSLDTTYCTNRAQRPLALFSGFNHYRQVVMFEAALMYDETTDSFKWLFETFLEAHGNKKPQTMFTDQDQAMSKALGEVMPETHHGLCTWHLMQNGIKHLGNLMKDGSHFLTDFKKCMYQYENEGHFEAGWEKMLLDHGVQENTWLKSVYVLREKWAACYMKQAFTLGMRSTQLSESLNSDFKAAMKSTVNITQFFRLFERVVEEKRYKELKAEYDARHKLLRLSYQHSSILNQAARIYTHSIFTVFQQEFDLLFAVSIRQRKEDQLVKAYVLSMANQEGEWTVLFDPGQMFMSCTCRKFETYGILCCHVLKIFVVLEVEKVPDHYVLTQWTKNTCNGIVHDVKGKGVDEDPKLESSRWYRHICSKAVRLASEVASSEELRSLVEKGIDGLCKQVMDVHLGQQIHGDEPSRPSTSEYDGVCQVRGLKTKVGLVRRRRPKSWVKLQRAKRRKDVTITRSRYPPYRGNGSSSSLLCEVTCSAPPAPYDGHQNNKDHFSFTRFLMEPLDISTQSLEHEDM